MSSNVSNSALELIWVIVNFGVGDKIVKYSKRCGITGGTVFLGKGTVPNNKWLEFLALNDVRKEIVLMIGTQDVVCSTLDHLNEEFKLSQPGKGIAFSTPLEQIIGSNQFSKEKGNVKVENSKYNIIVTIVERGRAELVIEAAKAAGSKGGTIINARGSGVHETSKLFNMEISPEKEIVLIVSGSDVTDSIVAKISANLDIDKPGNGIIFVEPLNKAYGLFTGQDSEVATN